MRKLPVVLCGALLAGLAACKDPLSVENQNNADVNHALGTPTDLENFIGATYNTVHAGTLGGGNDALNPQMFTMSLENVSGLANFAMGPRGQIPRNPIDNTPNAQGDAGNLRDWTVEHRAARMATRYSRWAPRRATPAPGCSPTSRSARRSGTWPWRTIRRRY